MMRGIESRHELDPTLLLRDTRTLTQRLADFFADPTNISIVLFTLSAMSYYFSEVATLLMLLGVLVFCTVIHENKNYLSGSPNFSSKRL